MLMFLKFVGINSTMLNCGIFQDMQYYRQFINFLHNALKIMEMISLVKVFRRLNLLEN